MIIHPAMSMMSRKYNSNNTHKQTSARICVVIPTIRTLSFLHDWADQFSLCHLIIVEDHEQIQIETPDFPAKSVSHYSWKDIRKEFGADEWIFSRKNAGIRSYGFWKAYQSGADTIITLDDDCYPVDQHFVRQHTDNLSARAPDRWTTTYPDPAFMFTRGVPYAVRNARQTVISHGLWTNKIDLDGITEQHYPRLNLPWYPGIRQFIPAGVYFPMCSMNLAFTRCATPLMYFPLMGYDPSGRPWGYDRFDDIWAGIFAKKICDHLCLSVANGSPFVEHRKASDVRSNIIREAKGIKTNERLWHMVDRVGLTKRTITGAYRELADAVEFPKEKYFTYLRKAMKIWIDLF